MILNKNIALNNHQKSDFDLLNYVNRICDLLEQYEPQVLSLLNEENRRERLLKEANILISKYPDYTKRPKLFGLLIAVKDLFNVDGFETRAGSLLPSSTFIGKEASCVTKLKNEGALILGKSVTTEFAYFQPGPTRNPLNLEHTPGGSSSGSAAAVASGFCNMALGTQTIGSVTRPASFCGIIGFKPSFGRISTDGVVPFSPSADHIGFFVRSIEEINLYADVLIDNWNYVVSENTLNIGIPDGNYIEQASYEAIQAFDACVNQLKSKGLNIKHIKMFDDIEIINSNHQTLIAKELADVHRIWFAKHEHLYRKHTKELILKGQKITNEAVEIAKKSQLNLRRMLENMMQQEQIDVFICPSTVTAAPKGIESTGSPIMNLPWTHCGLPTVTIPAGISKDGLPLGLQIIGKFMQDELLIDLAKAIQVKLLN